MTTVKYKQVGVKSQKDASQKPISKHGPGLSDFHQSPLLQHYRNIGNGAVQRLLESRAIQAKLKIGSPNDKLKNKDDQVIRRLWWISFCTDVKDKYSLFIKNATQFGIPTKVLRFVEKHYDFYTCRFLQSDRTQTYADLIEFKKDTLDDVEEMTSLKGGNIGISIIYEESIHAYFDIMKNDKNVSEIILNGIEHYKDAPLIGGGKVNDPERIFQEAAAGYAAYRVAAWWVAFLELSMVASGRFSKKRVRYIIEKTRKKYNQDMAKRRFGYQKTVWGDQIYTKREITKKLKDYLDNVLLEGKIPDNFDKVGGFKVLIEKATGTKKEFKIKK